MFHLALPCWDHALLGVGEGVGMPTDKGSLLEGVVKLLVPISLIGGFLTGVKGSLEMLLSTFARISDLKDVNSRLISFCFEV